MPSRLVRFTGILLVALAAAPAAPALAGDPFGMQTARHFFSTGFAYRTLPDSDFFDGGGSLGLKRSDLDAMGAMFEYGYRALPHAGPSLALDVVGSSTTSPVTSEKVEVITAAARATMNWFVVSRDVWNVRLGAGLNMTNWDLSVGDGFSENRTALGFHGLADADMAFGEKVWGTVSYLYSHASLETAGVDGRETRVGGHFVFIGVKFQFGRKGAKAPEASAGSS